MSRPWYESEADRQNQLQVVEICAGKWRCTFMLTQKAREYDVVFIRNNRTVCYAEIKCRTNGSKKYPTYDISSEKWVKLVSLARNTKLPVLIIVRYVDKLVYCNVIEALENGLVEFGPIRRNGRGDILDEEDGAKIRPEAFVEV